MLNRWWSVSETCGELDTSLSFGVEDVEQCCATSRHIIIGATSPQVALRSTSGYAWFAISDGPSMQSLGLWQYALWNNRCRHTTARAVATSITSR